MATDSNVSRVRGRLSRDPHYTKDDKFVLFTVVASYSRKDKDGIDTTGNDYVEVKVFNSDLTSQLRAGGLNQGAVVTVTGRGGAELNEYEKDGETRRSARQIVTISDTGNEETNNVVIESLGKDKTS